MKKQPDNPVCSGADALQGTVLPTNNVASGLLSGHRRGSQASIQMDAVRALAALAVFASHLRALFFVDYAEVTAKSPFIKLFYLLTGLGHEAVVVFFILSGYLISASVIKALQRDRWEWRHYLFHRFTRLYVVLIPALLLTAFWDHWGMRQFGLTGVYGGVTGYSLMIPEPVNQRLGLTEFIGNLFYLQGIRVAPYGSNGPLWSLSYEFWYYLLFPLGAIALLTRRRMTERAGCLLLMILLLTFVGKQIALYFLIWLMGTVACVLPPVPAFGKRVCLFLSMLGFLGALVLSRYRMLPSLFLSDFLIDVTFTAVLLSLLNSGNSPVAKWYERTATSLSALSYTLYLAHVPLLVFLNAWLLGEHSRWQPTTRYYAVSLFLGLMTLSYVFLVWRLTEAKTERVRQRLQVVFRL